MLGAGRTEIHALSYPLLLPILLGSSQWLKDEGERLGYKVIVNNADNSVERQVAAHRHIE